MLLAALLQSFIRLTEDAVVLLQVALAEVRLPMVFFFNGTFRLEFEHVNQAERNEVILSLIIGVGINLLTVTY